MNKALEVRRLCPPPISEASQGQAEKNHLWTQINLESRTSRLLRDSKSDSERVCRRTRTQSQRRDFLSRLESSWWTDRSLHRNITLQPFSFLLHLFPFSFHFSDWKEFYFFLKHFTAQIHWVRYHPMNWRGKKNGVTAQVGMQHYMTTFTPFSPPHLLFVFLLIPPAHHIRYFDVFQTCFRCIKLKHPF